MKTIVCSAILGFACTVALGESAHKGWDAVPDRWPEANRTRPFREGRRGSAYQGIPIKYISLHGPWARVDRPDPPPKGPFSGNIWFKQDAKLELQKVYLLSPSDDGSLKQREIAAMAWSVHEKPVVEGYLAASFKTEVLSFSEGDVFAVVLKIDGKPTTIFLRILYYPFVPS